MKHSLLLTICLFLTGGASSFALTSYTPQQGDILFQSLPHLPVIDAIEGCTGSPFSHCGIVVNKGGTWHVLEAIGPVKMTRLDYWISQGREEAFAACRLKAAFQPKVSTMIAEAEKFIGLPYDIQYELDDEKIYCSELIYKGFKAATGQSLGKIVKLGELNWKPHVRIIRAIAGDPIPLAREMITPCDLAKAEQLEEVLPLEKHVVLSKLGNP